MGAVMVLAQSATDSSNPMGATPDQLPFLLQLLTNVPGVLCQKTEEKIELKILNRDFDIGNCIRAHSGVYINSIARWNKTKITKYVKVYKKVN